jgi:hypothetical protein
MLSVSVPDDYKRQRLNPKLKVSKIMAVGGQQSPNFKKAVCPNQSNYMANIED